MRSYSIMLSFLMLFTGFPVDVSAQTKAPRVFVLNKSLLEANKTKVAGKDSFLLPAYKELLREADQALKQVPMIVMEKKMLPPSGDKHDYMSLAPYFWRDSTKPHGLPYIRKDGQTNPEVKDYSDKQDMPKMINLVQTLALAYYFSDNEQYAKHAAQLLKTWFLDTATRMNPNLNYAQAIKGVNQGRGAGLIDARHFIKIVDAIGLIQKSKHWKKADQEGMRIWFGDFLTWMQTSKNGIDESDAPNNHGTWYDALRLSLALFIDDRLAANKIVACSKLRLDQQMDETGQFPKEMDAYELLIIAASKLHCGDCKDAISKLPGRKEAKLRLNLLY